jgi:hypothetical protein
MTMDDSISNVEAELRISPKLVLAALLALGCLLFLGAELLSYPWHTVSRIISLLLLLSASSITGWSLANWKPLIGQWFTVLTLVTAVHLARHTRIFRLGGDSYGFGCPSGWLPRCGHHRGR